jgi:cell division protein FtsL
MNKRLLACFGLGVSALIFGISLVWVNLELVDLSYSIKEMHDVLESEQKLKSKLEVEHMNLISSYQMREKAAALDLHPPASGQIRILGGREK